MIRLTASSCAHYLDVASYTPRWASARMYLLGGRQETRGLRQRHVNPCLLGVGTSGSCTLWQRINVMQVMRALSFEAYFVHYLFCCFDLVQDAKLKVVQEMSNKFAAIVDSAARLASDPGDDDPLHSIASLYQTRANSRSSCLP